MKNILIPMDFTQVACNALEYASKLFEFEKLHIVHTTFGTYFNDGKFDEPRIEKKQILKTELTKDVLRILKVDTLPENVEVKILNGETIPTLIKYAKENNITEIVMGTRDKYSLFDKWLGTVSLRLIKTTNLPVYLIPPRASFKGFKKVLIASDAHLNKSSAISEIKSWNETHQAFLEFLHINQPNQKDKYVNPLDLLFTDSEPTFGFEMKQIVDTDISGSLLALAHNDHCDLIIAVPDNQNFIQGLMFISISKDLILKTDTPLLFLKG